MKKFEFLSHTADQKFKIYGKNLKELIINSLLALKSFFKPKLTKSKIEKEIKIKNEKTEILLIDFLSEVLAQTYIEKAIFTDFQEKNLNAKLIEGKILGFYFIKLTKDIKAITYHQAKIEKINNLFTFEFIVDI
ncbi:MAG: hypothetical protein C4278_00815 [Patescibacteria group bacterium]